MLDAALPFLIFSSEPFSRVCARPFPPARARAPGQNQPQSPVVGGCNFGSLYPLSRQSDGGRRERRELRAPP